MCKTAIYPGSFDPVTNGHIDIISRGLIIFYKLIATILENPAKTTLFTIEERMELLAESLKEFNNRVEIASCGGLLVDYSIQRNAQATRAIPAPIP